MEEPIWDISADMTTTASPGGCQCGQFRYEIDIERALTLVACHCRECQKQSASAFGLVMPIPRSTFTRLQGELKIWERVADSGRKVENSVLPPMRHPDLSQLFFGAGLHSPPRGHVG